MCLRTTGYANCGCGCVPVSHLYFGPMHCVPCLTGGEEEIAQLERCLETMKEKARTVEERLSLIKKKE